MMLMILQESLFQSSPTSRRDSSTLLDKVKQDAGVAAKAKGIVAAAAENEEEQQQKQAAHTPSGGDDLPIVKYVDTQARSRVRGRITQGWWRG